jgi:hypothetical protein
MLLLLACAHKAETGFVAPPIPNYDPSCEKAAVAGIEQNKSSNYSAAWNTWDAGYQRCGPGYGFLVLLAVEKARQGDWDAAADLTIRELSEPFPNTASIDLMASLLPKVSPEKRAQILALGTTTEKPLIVPSVGAEYEWIELLCGQRIPVKQALIQGPAGMQDLMEFTCPDNTSYTLYFDFSADPMERAFRAQLEGK